MNKSILVHLVLASALAVSTCFSTRAQSMLYGMTRDGGQNNKGVPFQVATDGSYYLSFRDFNGTDAERPGNGARFAQLSDQDFIGTGFTIAGFAALTELGGQQQSGNRFDIKVRQSGLLSPFRFNLNEGIGLRPAGSFYLNPDGKFYMTTSAGGEFGGGTLLQVPLVFGNGPALLGSFDGPNNGRSPKGTPVIGANGRLYGTAEFGGKDDLGVIFSCSDFPNDYGLRKVFDFDGSSGAYPTGDLLLATDGQLYGMTTKGGVNNAGVIFSIRHDGSGFRKLLDLSGSTGANPHGSLVQRHDGLLYGMTSAGGIHGNGTIFRIGLEGTFEKLHDFNGQDGKSPLGTLLIDNTGNDLYGVCLEGGINNVGVFFKLERGAIFRKLRDFNSPTGSHPVGSLVMERLEPSLTVPEMARTVVAGGEPFQLEFTTGNNMPVYIASEDTTIVSVRGNKLYPKTPGGVSIRIYQRGDHVYMPIEKRVYVQVDRKPQTIQFEIITVKKFGRDKVFELSCSSTSGLPVSITPSRDAVATITGNTVTIYGAGAIDLIARQEGNATYAQADVVVRPLIVERGDQTITFRKLGETVVCCNTIYLNATSSAGGTVLFKASDRSKLDIYGTSATQIGVGSVDVIAYHPGSQNYNPAEAVQSIRLVKGFNFMSFYVNRTTYSVGENPVYAAVSGSVPPTSVISEPPGIAEYENGYLYFLSPGKATITARHTGNVLYDPTTASVTITVNPAKNVDKENNITWPSFSQTRYLADGHFNLNAYSSSGLPVRYSSSNPDVLKISGNHVTLLKAGTSVITALQNGNDTLRSATPLTRQITVSKSYHSSYLSLSSYLSPGEELYPVPVYSNAGLPVTYSVSDPGVGSIENYYFKANASGTVTITASHPGNDQYESFHTSTTVYVGTISNDIFFSQIRGTIKAGGPPISLIGQSSSGYPVMFSSDNPGIVSITGDKMSPIGAGHVIVEAFSSSGSRRLSSATQYITIEKGDQKIMMDELANKNFADPSFTISASSSAQLPVAFTTTTPEVIRVSGSRVSIIGTGLATLVASQTGDVNYNPAADVIRRFEVSGGTAAFDLVGTTSEGGPNGGGVIYRIKSTGDGVQYIKQFDPNVAPLPDGGFIIGLDGNLYGVLRGAESKGRVVRLDHDGTNLKTVHEFIGSDGENPRGSLVQGEDGYLYGTTYQGGAFDGGTIYKVKPDGSAFTTMYQLSPQSGRSSAAGLALSSDGKLFGMTTLGGFEGYGTIFSIRTDGTDFTLLRHLDYGTGYDPSGPVTLGGDGAVYGTLSRGGLNNRGYIFRMNSDGHQFSAVLEFDISPTAGAGPAGGTLIVGGVIYGVTTSGGASGVGTIYSVNMDGSNAKQLFNFNGTNGSYPVCSLTAGSDGRLYGGSQVGGANGSGTIFSIMRDGTGFTTLADLDNRAWSFQTGPLLEVEPGLFLGATRNGGTRNSGALFTVTAATGLTIVNDFTQGDFAPRAMIVDPTGKYYYGVTSAEEWNDGGGIYRIDAEGTNYQQIYKIVEGETLSSIAYSSDGHLWFSGETYNLITGISVSFLKRINTDGSDIQSIAGYPAESYNNAQALVQGPNGHIYGLSRGRNNNTVFRVNKDGSGYRIIASMSNQESFNGNILVASDGNMYFGAGDSGIFKIDATEQVKNIFKYPSSIVGSQRVYKLIELNGGRLAMATRSNGVEGRKPGINGAILSIEKDGSGFYPIYFPKIGEGGSPVDMIQSFDGWLFVSSSFGGSGNGIVYKVRPDGSSYTPVRIFDGRDGSRPGNVFFIKHQQNLFFDPLPESTTATPAFFPKLSSSSGAPVTLTSSNTAVVRIEDGKIVPVKRGTSIITATLPENANYYDGGRIERVLTVVRGEQSITFEEIADKTLRDAEFILAATASSGLPITFTSSDPAVASINDQKVLIHKTGTIMITASQEGNDDFFPAKIVSKRLVVLARRTQSIEITNPGIKTVGDAAFDLKAEASSGLPLTLSSQSSGITISGTTVSIVSAGKVVVKASQDGNEEYDASTREITFCINPAKPQIVASGVFPDLQLQSSSEADNRWYYNGTALEGATSQVLKPLRQGSYTVQVVVDDCQSALSEPYDLIATAIDEHHLDLVEMYPNPVYDEMKIKLTSHVGKSVAVEIVDIVGKQVFAGKVEENELTLDLSSMPGGIYFAHLRIGNSVVTRKFVKN